MKKIVAIILIGMTIAVYSQSPLLWSEDYQVNSTYYYSGSPRIVPENENSFKVVGRKNTNDGQRLSVIRYGISGSILSEQIFGDTVFDNQIIDYKFDNSNHLYILNLEVIHINKTNIILQKYSLDGNLIWTEQIQDFGAYSYYPLFVSISENGTIFITGEKYIFDYDVYYEFSHCLFAYDSDGNQLWERIFNGATELEYIFVNYIYNDEIYLFGMDYATFQVFKLVKVDVNNNMTLNVFTDLQNGVKNVHLTQDNKLLIAASAKYRISKMNLDGSLLWSEYYQENPPVNTYSEGISSSIQDEDGNIYLTGGYRKYNSDHPNSTGSDILTLKFDSNGSLLWQNLYQYEGNKTDVGNVITLKNGNIYVGGHSQNEAVTGYDYVVLKIDAETGITNGVYRYNGLADGSDSVSSIYVFDDGKVALTGLSYNGTDFDWTTQLLSDIVLSVEDVSNENTIKVYPNPVQKNHILSIVGDDLNSYSVYNSVGQIVCQGRFEQNNIHTIKLDNLVSGMYVLQLNTDKDVIVKRIVVN